MDGMEPAPPALDPAKQKLFLDIRPDPPAGVFELGLVLGGTVSAGAYTAGALDLLIEALDAWQQGIDGGPPPHKVQVSVAGGSSGGAVCAAIFSLLTGRALTHIHDDQATLNGDDAFGKYANKLWEVWVDQFQFTKLLDPGDIGGVIDDGLGAGNRQRVPALLNGAMIDAACADLVAFADRPPDTDRPWAAKPFRLVTTVANLRGVPYTIQAIPIATGYTGSAYVQHDDFVWFAVPNWIGPPPAGIDLTQRPDEFWLASTPVAGVSVGYQVLADYARASGAMPVGLPARPLTRPPEHYLYRPVARATDAGAVVEWPAPDWGEFGVGTYEFTGVDGGTLNNDPVSLVHHALAGTVGHNTQDPALARRAMFMIDPLADEPGKLATTGRSLVAVAGAIVPTFVGGARYLTSDLELFASQDVFSRFQLVPHRVVRETLVTGEAALAGTDLFALAGWCARPFRVHDYLLGRANMLSYLQSEFLLHADNALFDKWSVGQRGDYARAPDGSRLTIPITDTTPKDSYYLPVVPLAPGFAAAPMPDWPGGFDPEALRGDLQARVSAVLDALRADNLPGVAPWFLALLILPGLETALTDALITAFKAQLGRPGRWLLATT